MGVDGLSLWLIILLSTLLTPIAILISWNSIQDRAKEFFAFLLLLECGLIGVFAAYDLFLFLRILGTRARAYVFPHRHVGRHNQRPCQ